jgi:N-acetylglucosaminyldiphosphoundecaprenol N-acetyl-beta-D-mannosaminyltransferase
VPVDRVGPAAAVAMLERAATGEAPSAYTVAINPEKIMRAARDPALRAAIEGAALRFPDGVGVVLASRLRGGGITARVTGIDLAAALLGRCAVQGWPVYLLGAAPGVAEAAAAAWRERLPDLPVAGARDGYFRGAEEEVCAAIRTSGARVVLAALGSPAQELWLAAHLAHTGARLGVGVGGAFDVWAGRTARAPRAMRAIGLEWLYRLVKEPWRARRMLALPAFLWAAVRERRTGSA